MTSIFDVVSSLMTRDAGVGWGVGTAAEETEEDDEEPWFD